LLVFLIAMASAAAADWEPLGPFGGSAAIVQMDYQQGVVLAATSNAQLFKSSDDGDSWVSLPFPARSRARLHALAIDRQNPGVYFVGLSGDASEYSGIMRTADGGLTWNRIPEPGLKNVWSIAIWPEDSQVIAAGTEEGLWLTEDGGTNWALTTPVDDPELKPVVSIAFDPWDSQTLYLGTPHLAWKTTDGGSAWQPIHEGMINDSDVFYLLADYKVRNKLFAATCGGIYRSVDRGEQWTKLRQAPGASYRVYHIAQDPLRPNVVLAGTTLGLVRSMDGGSTWRRISTQSTRWIAFDIIHENRIFVATDENGILRSDDLGDSLQEVNRGFSNRRFVGFETSGDELYVIAVTPGGSSRLRRAEPGWEEVPVADPPAEPPMHVRYPSAPDADSGIPEDSLWIHDIVATSGGALLGASPRGLVRSNDAGETWQSDAGILGGNTLRALCRHSTQPGVFFAAVYGEIYRSTDDGRSWTSVAGDAGPSDFTALMVLAGTPDQLLAISASSGVYALALRRND